MRGAAHPSPSPLPAPETAPSLGLHHRISSGSFCFLPVRAEQHSSLACPSLKDFHIFISTWDMVGSYYILGFN